MDQVSKPGESPNVKNDDFIESLEEYQAIDTKTITPNNPDEIVLVNGKRISTGNWGKAAKELLEGILSKTWPIEEFSVIIPFMYDMEAQAFGFTDTVTDVQSWKDLQVNSSEVMKYATLYIKGQPGAFGTPFKYEIGLRTRLQLSLVDVSQISTSLTKGATVRVVDHKNEIIEVMYPLQGKEQLDVIAQKAHELMVISQHIVDVYGSEPDAELYILPTSAFNDMWLEKQRSIGTVGALDATTNAVTSV